MTQLVGEVEVGVKANLDKYIVELQRALRILVNFSTAASRELNNVTRATSATSAATEDLGRQTTVTSTATRALGEAFNVVTNSARQSLGILPTLAGAAGIGGVVLAAQQAVQAYGQWEQQQIQFEGRLRSTQGQLGMTAQEITSLAQSISRDTLTPMEQLRSFALELGRSGEVTTETLQRALRILPDLTLRVGDFGQASRILSEALRNPAESVRLLRDAGVQFSQQQRTLLEGTESFADRLLNASEVLNTLERQIGGEAGALGRGVTGGFSALASAVAQFTINLGGSIDQMFGFSAAARSTATAIDTLNAALFPTSWEQRIAAAHERVVQLRQELEALTSTLGATSGGPQLSLPTNDLEEFIRRSTALRDAQIDVEILNLSRAYETADRQAVALARTQEQLATRFRDALKAITDQTEGLNAGRNRAEVRAREIAGSLGITDPAQIRQLTQAYQALFDAQRRIAQADRLTIFERENERLESQIQLLQYGNRELRIRAELNRIALAAERARQPLTATQREELEANIRTLERVRELTSTVNSAFTSLFSSMTNALAEFAATGKFEFKQFADSIIRDMVRIASQAFIVQPLMNAITGMTNPLIAGAFGVQFEGGGGGSIPQFASGGSFTVPGGEGGGDKPALLVGLTPGERVDITPAGKTTRGQGGSITVVNNVNSTREFEVQQTEREGPNGERIVEQTFNEVMRRIGRGEADNTLGARFGMRPRTVQR